MNHLIRRSLLLAEGDPFRGLSGGFKPEQNQHTAASVLVVVLVFFGLIGLLWFLARLADWRRQRGPSHSPRLLLISLGRAHGLSWRELFLLWRMARRQRLADPARLFVEPERWGTRHTSIRGSRLPGRLEAIHRRLFAGLVQPDPVPRDSPPADPASEEDPETQPIPFPLLATPPAVTPSNAPGPMPHPQAPVGD